MSGGKEEARARIYNAVVGTEGSGFKGDTVGGPVGGADGGGGRYGKLLN